MQGSAEGSAVQPWGSRKPRGVSHMLRSKHARFWRGALQTLCRACMCKGTRAHAPGHGTRSLSETGKAPAGLGSLISAALHLAHYQDGGVSVAVIRPHEQPITRSHSGPRTSPQTGSLSWTYWIRSYCLITQKVIVVGCELSSQNLLE